MQVHPHNRHHTNPHTTAAGGVKALQRRRGNDGIGQLGQFGFGTEQGQGRGMTVVAGAIPVSSPAWGGPTIGEHPLNWLILRLQPCGQCISASPTGP